MISLTHLKMTILQSKCPIKYWLHLKTFLIFHLIDRHCQLMQRLISKIKSNKILKSNNWKTTRTNKSCFHRLPPICWEGKTCFCNKQFQREVSSQNSVCNVFLHWERVSSERQKSLRWKLKKEHWKSKKNIKNQNVESFH